MKFVEFLILYVSLLILILGGADVLKHVRGRPAIWGPLFWERLHCLAINIGMGSCPPKKWETLLEQHIIQIPCLKCRIEFRKLVRYTHMREWVKLDPLVGPLVWIHCVHNMISLKANRELYDLWEPERDLLLNSGYSVNKTSTYLKTWCRQYKRNQLLVDCYNYYNPRGTEKGSMSPFVMLL